MEQLIDAGTEQETIQHDDSSSSASGLRSQFGKFIALVPAISLPVPSREFILLEFPGAIEKDPEKALKCIGGEQAVSKLKLPLLAEISKQGNAGEGNFLQSQAEMEERESSEGDSEPSENERGIREKRTRISQNRIMSTKRKRREMSEISTAASHSSGGNAVEFEDFVGHQLRCDFSAALNDNFDKERTHGLYSETKRAKMFLLKIRRRKKPVGDVHQDVKINVLGKVSFQILFPGFGDIAWNSDLPSHIPASERLDVHPPRFCVLDTPQDYNFQPGIVHKNQLRKEKYSTMRKLYFSGIFVEFECAQVPNGPPQDTVAASEKSKNHEVTRYLCKLFEERPIWSKVMLYLRMPDSSAQRVMLKYLPSVGYRFSSGTWRGLWVRYGYDPRKIPASRIYQFIELRLDPEQAKALGIQYLERISSDIPYRQAIQESRLQFRKTQEEAALSKHRRNRRSKSELENSGEIDLGAIPMMPITQRRTTMDDLKFKRPPMHAVYKYQLCDLFGQEFESLVHNSPSTGICSKLSGWYPQKTYADLRMLMKLRIQHWINERALGRNPTSRNFDSSSLESVTNIDNSDEKVFQADDPNEGVDEDLFAAEEELIYYDDMEDFENSLDQGTQQLSESDQDEFEIFGE